MSHFVCVCFIPRSVKNITERLARQLAPFSEGKRVRSYEETCHCINLQATNQAIADCEKRFGTLENFRDEVTKQIDANPELKAKRAENPFDADVRTAIDQLWKPWNDFQAERMAVILPTQKPKSDCGTCKGKGVYRTTYNPQSKWDWYSIGGRWTGFFSGYNPYEDPKNKTVCALCSGSGVRPDMPVYAEGADPLNSKPIRREPAKCNGCGGTGKSVKWPTEWGQHEEDIIPVENWLSLLRANKSAGEKKYVPYAILTRDKTWLQRGQMGWFGMSSNEQPSDVWEDQVLRVVEQHLDCVAVVVDCHI